MEPENPDKKPPIEKNRPEETMEPVFYYSREHRLARAPQSVRDLYEQPARPGLVRSLLGSRANLLLLVSILIVCVTMLFGSRSARETGSMCTFLL